MSRGSTTKTTRSTRTTSALWRVDSDALGKKSIKNETSKPVKIETATATEMEGELACGGRGGFWLFLENVGLIPGPTRHSFIRLNRYLNVGKAECLKQREQQQQQQQQ